MESVLKRWKTFISFAVASTMAMFGLPHLRALASQESNEVLTAKTNTPILERITIVRQEYKAHFKGAADLSLEDEEQLNENANLKQWYNWSNWSNTWNNYFRNY